MISGIPVSFRIFYDLPKDDTKVLGLLKKPEPIYKLGEYVRFDRFNPRYGLILKVWEKDDSWKYNIQTFGGDTGLLFITIDEKDILR